jgi:hypothetical protein
MEKMTLIEFKRTQHVLAAVTKHGDPEGTLAPSELVGNGLSLRDPASGNPRLTIEPQELKVEVVDRIDQVLLAPQRYAVINGVVEEQIPLTSDPIITFDGTNIQLQLPTNGPLDVWVQVDGPPASSIRLVRALKIPNDTTNQTDPESMPLLAGAYFILVLAPGYRPYVSLRTLP